MPWFCPQTHPSFFHENGSMQFQLGSFISLPPIRKLLGLRAFEISLCLSVQPGSISADIKFSRTFWVWISWMFTPLDERFFHRSSVDNLFSVFSFYLDGWETMSLSFPMEKIYGPQSPAPEYAELLIFQSFSKKFQWNVGQPHPWLFLKPCFQKQFLNFSITHHMEKLIISQIINPWFLKSQTMYVRKSS